MQVIICGAGQVGSNIARYLAADNHDVTLIDVSQNLISKASELLDVKGIVGHAAHPEVLHRAGAKDADMLIAVTQVDEVNMIACQVAHSLFDVGTKIARVRQGAYLTERWQDLYNPNHLPIDLIISPEVEVAKAIARRLEVPGAFDVQLLAKEKIIMLGVRCTPETPILDTPVSQLNDLFPDLHMTVLCVVRGEEFVFLDADEVLLVGDEVYLVAERGHLARVMSAYGHEEEEGRRALIVGAGNIGSHLAQILEAEHPQMRLKIIEKDRDRATQAAQFVSRTVVLHGDALDQELLDSAGTDQTETLVAVSNDDEVNILSSLLAKRQGVKKVITLINKRSYSSLISQLGIDAVVNPRSITVSRILEHVRRGRVGSVNSIADGKAEVLELEALDTAAIVGQSLKSAKLPNGIVVGMIMREGKTIVPRGETTIQPQDTVIVFSLSNAVNKLEKFFTVDLEFF